MSNSEGLGSYKPEFEYKNSTGKRWIGIMITIVLLLSAVFIGVELYRSDGPIVNLNETTTENRPQCQSSGDTIECCCVIVSDSLVRILPTKAVSEKEYRCFNAVPSGNQGCKTVTYSYTNINKMLLYVSFIVLASLCLVGCFVALLKMLHAERENRNAVEKVRLDLFKEAQSAYITKLKKQEESKPNKTAEEKTSDGECMIKIRRSRLENLEKNMKFIKDFSIKSNSSEKVNQIMETIMAEILDLQKND